MSNFKTVVLQNENKTVELGGFLANASMPGLCIYLTGDLGAGKTTLTRGFVQNFGYKGTVKSPTYTLVENYKLDLLTVYHFDLYRLLDPEELEFMGIRDYFDGKAISLVEWPDKGEGYIANPDLEVHISYDHESRIATITAFTEKGQNVLEKLSCAN